METTEIANLFFLNTFRLADDRGEEDRNLLDYIEQVHRGPPFRLPFGKKITQKISSVGQRRVAKPCLRRDQRWLEGKLVTQ